MRLIYTCHCHTRDYSLWCALTLSYPGIRTEVGRQAEEIVAQGNLLPDDVMLKVVASKLESLNNRVSLP